MQRDPHYADATLDLIDYFTNAWRRCRSLACPPAKVLPRSIMVSGKKDPHNLPILFRSWRPSRYLAARLPLGVPQELYRAFEPRRGAEGAYGN